MKMAQNITQIETAGTHMVDKLSKNVDAKSIIKILIGSPNQSSSCWSKWATTCPSGTSSSAATSAC